MSELEQSEMRAGHADREKVVARLNTAFAEGRLEVGELDERVAAAYAAKKLGDLVPLTADLPAAGGRSSSPVPRPAAAPQPSAAGSRGPDWSPVAGAFGLFMVNVLIWGIISLSTQNLIYFWPIWTAIPMVFAVIGVASTRKRH